MTSGNDFHPFFPYVEAMSPKALLLSISARLLIDASLVLPQFSHISPMQDGRNMGELMLK